MDKGAPPELRNSPASAMRAIDPGRATLAECICSHHRRPTGDFMALAWRCGARWPTRMLRPLILRFAPRYFEAEDVHLERAAGCHRRDEIAEELQFIRLSYLRRGFWRYFGIGVNGDRLLRYYDSLQAIPVVASDAKPIAEASTRSRTPTPMEEQSRP